MPRVLMLAHWFPPCRRWPTAGRRVEGFARHLPKYGWDALVLTPDLGAHDLCDCGAAHDGDLPGLDVRRFPLRPSRAAALSRGGPTPRPGPAGTSPSRAAMGPTLRSAFESRGRWLTEAYGAVSELLRSDSFDVIWTTSSPHSSVMVGARAQRSSGLPWVADLRDPVDDIVLAPGAHHGPQQMLRRVAVKPALRRAAAVVAATRGSAEADARSLGREVTWVYSGLSEAWIEEAATARRHAGPQGGSAPREVVLTGAIYAGTMELAPLLTALAELVRSSVDLVLVYLGPDGAVLKDAAAQVGFDAVDDRGVRRPEEVRQVLATSDVNLLLEHAGTSKRIPGKVFELLASARPIVCVPGSSAELSSLLIESSLGTVASTADSIAGAIRDSFGSPPPSVDTRGLEPWLTSTAARHLGAVLDDVRRHSPG